MDPLRSLGLPSAHIEDLQRFHDPLLAIKHGASAAAIADWIKHLEKRWWDTAGFQHEYEQELRRLRWTRECWLRLERTQRVADEEFIAGQLHELRRLLGPSMYYAGRMPDYPPAALQFLQPEFAPFPRSIPP